MRYNKHWERTKQDLSDSSLSHYDFSDKSDYKNKRRDKKKICWKKKHNPIKLCAELTAKFLMTAYKSKILKFKLDEYLL